MEFHYSLPNYVDYVPRSNHTNNCVVEEIPTMTIETDTSEVVWASLDDKVGKSSSVSSDSCESDSLVVSKTKLVPFSPKFDNPFRRIDLKVIVTH